MACRWRVPVRTLLPLLITAVAVLATAGCKATAGMPTSPSASSHADPADEAKARKELAELQVRQPGTMAGYDRDRFGPAWKDVDRNGCDTRNDILARDLANVRKRNQCVIIAGDLHDPYTGKDITFVKAQAYQVQIDHIVPLALAWRMGANEWTEDKRTELANDPGNLLAVWSRPNEQKGDKGPYEWKPRRDFQCRYAENFIAVAYEYRLAVTNDDRFALREMLGTC